jgi:ribosomal protein S18 acetylase RimI-like enzyme
VLLDGWVLRFAGGYTKRANSVNPLYASTMPAEAKLATCEQLYAAARLPCIFRLSDAGPEAGLDALLEARGYAMFERSLVLARPLDADDDRDAAQAPEMMTVDVWLDHYLRLSNANPHTRPAHQAILGNIATPHIRATRSRAGKVVACGLAVCQGPYAGIFDLIVDPAERRQGHGRALVESLLAWAYNQGAQQACLQVVGHNDRAIGLYHALGFRQAYTYWYRVQGQP